MKSVFHAATLWGAMILCFVALVPPARADNPTPAMTDQPLPKPAIVVALETATDGLLMPSETDAPFKIIFLAREPQIAVAEGKPEAQPEAEAKPETEVKAKAKAASVGELARLAGAPQEAAIETRDLDEFFAVATGVEEWMNEEERATAARFAILLGILKTQVKGAQVLVWGEAEKRVAIIGQAEGGLVGVTTLIVET